jgi:hypothetical protein
VVYYVRNPKNAGKSRARARKWNSYWLG